jgi:xylulokinase
MVGRRVGGQAGLAAAGSSDQPIMALHSRPRFRLRAAAADERLAARPAVASGRRVVGTACSGAMVMDSLVPDRSPAGPVLLGIDVGLSALKVAAFDAAGRLLGRASRTYPPRRIEADRVEEDPEQWLTLAAAAVRELLAGGVCRPAQVAGIGLSARGSGPVFVDAAGRALAPHWLDRRHAPQSRRLTERFGPYADTRSLPSKTLHLAEHYPELFARLAHPLFVKDFLLYRLTGAVATDPSSGPRGLVWPREVWDWIGFPVERVPPVRPHTAIGGRLLPAMAAAFGLPAGLPVGVGGHDGACANTGAGAILPGQVCLTLGTNGVARSIAAAPAPTVPWQGISAYHYLPGRWCCGGDAGLLGHAPTWLARLVERGHDALEAAARPLPPGAEGVTFLPFLNGQVSPTRRPERRAAWLGLHADAGQAHLYRAVLEGAACLLRQIAGRLAALGLGDGAWSVSGGGANSQLWLEIIAALLDRPLVLVEPEEGPRGACMYLAVGLGWYDSVEACAAEWVRVRATIEPAPELVAAYAPVFARFQRLEAAVAAAEHEVAAQQEELV